MDKMDKAPEAIAGVSERMNTMKCIQLLEGLSYKCLQGDVNAEVSAVVNDSRKLAEGCMFICIKGASFDGHTFAEEAAKKGAAVLLVEDPVDVPETVTVIQVESTRYAMALVSAAWFGHPAKELTTIAVTGTKGKTTTTYMIQALLEKAGHKTGVIGTIEVVIGDKHIAVNNTTPESYDIHRYFREMVDAGCDAVVMEASSQGFKLDRTAGIEFDYGLFTNLSPVISGQMSTKILRNTFPARRCSLPSAKRDLPIWMMNILRRLPPRRCVRYRPWSGGGRQSACAEYHPHRETTDFLGVDFDVSGLLNGRVSCGVPGTFNVHNALGAICVALEMGADYFHDQ